MFLLALAGIGAAMGSKRMIETVICLVKWAVHTIGQTVLTVVDFIATALIIAVNAIVAFLPNDPSESPDPIGGPLGMLNYFIPMEFIVGNFGLLMVAWVLYRLYEWLLRWAKAEG
jgi:hypothetical protein